MRGNLHAHDFHPRVGHDAQDLKHLNRVGRGQVAGQLCFPGDAPRCADDAAADARRLDDALEQIRRGGLALCARHANELHSPFRVAVEGAGHARHGRTHIGHDNLRTVHIQPAAPPPGHSIRLIAPAEQNHAHPPFRRGCRKETRFLHFERESAVSASLACLLPA